MPGNAGLRDEAGQGISEYALIVALVALACVAMLTAIAGAVIGSFGSVAAGL